MELLDISLLTIVPDFAEYLNHTSGGIHHIATKIFPLPLTRPESLYGKQSERRLFEVVNVLLTFTNLAMWSAPPVALFKGGKMSDDAAANSRSR
jgi:hypothetical protein